MFPVNREASFVAFSFLEEVAMKKIQISYKELARVKAEINKVYFARFADKEIFTYWSGLADREAVGYVFRNRGFGLYDLLEIIKEGGE